jgi:hypothetical protein
MRFSVGLDLNLERCSRNVPAVTYRESLRDIEACLRVRSSKLYHLGIRGAVARNTLANAKKRLTLPITLYETLQIQILSLTLFEKTPLDQVLARAVNDLDPSDPHNQMNLFE